MKTIRLLVAGASVLDMGTVRGLAVITDQLSAASANTSIALTLNAASSADWTVTSVYGRRDGFRLGIFACRAVRCYSMATVYGSRQRPLSQLSGTVGVTQSCPDLIQFFGMELNTPGADHCSTIISPGVAEALPLTHFNRVHAWQIKAIGVRFEAALLKSPVQHSFDCIASLVTPALGSLHFDRLYFL